MSAPCTLLALLAVGLAVASTFDVAERRIPNPVVAAIAATGLGARTWTGGAAGLLASALALAIVLALLLLPWWAGKLGGGDVKLAAAVAAWLELSQLPGFLVFSAVAGAPVALATLAARARRGHGAGRRLVAAGGPGAAVQEATGTVPVAVAIALGALAALRWRLP